MTNLSSKEAWQMVINGSVEVNVEQLRLKLDEMVTFVIQAASRKKSMIAVAQLSRS